MLISDRAGVLQIVELLEAQSTLADVRSENANARTFWYIALLQLAHDIGVIPLSGKPQPLELAVADGTGGESRFGALVCQGGRIGLDHYLPTGKAAALS